MQKFNKRVTAFLSRYGTFILVILLSLTLVVSRRPDALTMPQLWAEDGLVFFGQAYNLGPIEALFMPSAGSLQTLPRLVAGGATILPLEYAPMVMNLVAIAIQVLPVILLWTPRFYNLVSDVRARVLISFLYLAIPNSYEVNANITNVGWHLTLVAMLVLVWAAPDKRLWRLFDRLILGMAGLSGPFAFFLAPIAFMAWWRDRSRIRLERFTILLSAAVIQGVVMITSPRSGPVELGAGIRAFVRLLSGQVFLTPLLGTATAQEALPIHYVAWIVFVIGCVIVGYCLWKGPWALKMFILFGGIMLSSVMVRPLVVGTTPAWEVLSAGVVGRYFLASMVIWLVCLVWVAWRGWLPLRGLALSMLLIACVVGIPSDWHYPAYEDMGFQSQAKRFEQLPSGTVEEFAINPRGWYMDLVKH